MQYRLEFHMIIFKGSNAHGSVIFAPNEEPLTTQIHP